MTYRGTSFDELKALVETEHLPEYAEVDFPIVHAGAGTFNFVPFDPTSSILKFKLNIASIDYICYRLGINSAPIRTLWLTGQFDEAAKWINEFRHMQVDGKSGKASRRNRFIAAVVDGELYGLLTDYSPIRNDELLTIIESLHLQNRVKAWKFDPMSMEIYIASNFSEADEPKSKNVLFGTKVTNGQTGHISLKFKAFFNVGSLSHDLKLNDRSRHLGAGINSTLARLQEVIDTDQSVEVYSALERTSRREAIDWIAGSLEDAEKLHDIANEIANRLDHSKPQTAIDVLIALDSLSSEHGYKGTSQQLSKLLVEKALEEK